MIYLLVSTTLILVLLTTPLLFTLLCLPYPFLIFKRDEIYRFILTFALVKYWVAAFTLACFENILQINTEKILIFYSLELIFIGFFFVSFYSILVWDRWEILILAVLLVYCIIGYIGSNILSVISYARIYVCALLFYIIGYQQIHDLSFRRLVYLSVSICLTTLLVELVILYFDWEQVFDSYKSIKYFKNEDIGELTLHEKMTTRINGVWFPRLLGPMLHPTSFGYFFCFCFASILYVFGANRKIFLYILSIVLATCISFWISKGAFALCLFILVNLISFRVMGTLGVFIVCICYVGSLIILAFAGGTSGYNHALGLFYGIQNFINNPLGGGIGAFGNLSQVSNGVLSGNESAVGVGLSSMGVIFLIGYALCILKLFKTMAIVSRKLLPLIFFVLGGLLNGLLQEEAFSVLTVFYYSTILGLVDNMRYENKS